MECHCPGSLAHWRSRALAAEANARRFLLVDELEEALKKSRETFAALGVQEEINRIDAILAKIKGAK